MSNEEVVRRQVDALNRHDSASFVALYAQDAVVYDPAYDAPLRGREAIERDMVDFLGAFPDLHNALRTMVADGNLLAAEFSTSGTHNGPFKLPAGELPATGRSLKFDIGVFSRLNSSGEIVEERRYYDLAGQLQQLGVSL